MRKRFNGPRTARALALFNRFGDAGGAGAGDPAAAGAVQDLRDPGRRSRMSPWTFALAIILGRGFRYVVRRPARDLVRRAGDRLPRTNGRQVALWTGLAVLGSASSISGGDRGGGSPSRRRCRPPDGATELRHVVDPFAGRDLGLGVRRRPAQLEGHDRGGALERRAAGVTGDAGLGAAQHARRPASPPSPRASRRPPPRRAWHTSATTARRAARPRSSRRTALCSVPYSRASRSPASRSTPSSASPRVREKRREIADVAAGERRGRGQARWRRPAERREHPIHGELCGVPRGRVARADDADQPGWPSSA